MILVGEVEGPLPRGTPSFANRKCHHSTWTVDSHTLVSPEAQAQNTEAAGGDAQAGSGEIRFGEAMGSAAARLGGVQAAASSGEAASGSAIDVVGGKRRREEGGEAGGSESGAAGEGGQQGKKKSRRGKRKCHTARRADGVQRSKDLAAIHELDE